MTEMDRTHKKKAALVFSGGAMRGFSQFGAYKSIKEFLDRKNIEIDLIVGTSFGSITTSLISLGYEPEKMEAMAIKSGLRLANMMDLKVTGSGLLSGDYLKSRLSRYIGTITMSEVRKEIMISTVDIRSGKEYFFTRKGIETLDRSETIKDKDIKMIDAIRASTAIPALFVPVHMHGKILVDGGLVNSIALHAVDMKKYDIVIAVDVCMGNFDFVTNDRPNKIEMLAQSISISQRQFMFERMQKYMKRNNNMIMIKPNVGPARIRKKGEMERILKCGYDEAEKMLKSIEEKF